MFSFFHFYPPIFLFFLRFLSFLTSVTLHFSFPPPAYALSPFFSPFFTPLHFLSSSFPRSFLRLSTPTFAFCFFSFSIHLFYSPPFLLFSIRPTLSRRSRLAGGVSGGRTKDTKPHPDSRREKYWPGSWRRLNGLVFPCTVYAPRRLGALLALCKEGHTATVAKNKRKKKEMTAKSLLLIFVFSAS